MLPSTKPNNRRRRRAQPGRATQLTLSGEGDYRAVARNIARGARQAAARIPRSVVQQVANQVARQVINTTSANPVARVARGAARVFIGNGDYASSPGPTFNSLINAMSQTGPVLDNPNRREVRIRESEYIGDILSGELFGGSTAFTNQSYELNPANANTFPWLSRIAPLFDQWIPYGIVFEFRTTSSEFNGTTQALGVVVGALDYDNADPEYATRQEMENSDYAVSGKASRSFYMGVECAPSERPTRVLFTGPLPSGASSVSLNLYNLGTAQIATQGMSATGVTVGELWIHYDIGFLKKQVRPVSNTGTSASFSRFRTSFALNDSLMAGTWGSDQENDVDTIGGIFNEATGEYSFPPTFRGRVLITAMFEAYADTVDLNFDVLTAAGGHGWSVLQPGDSPADDNEPIKVNISEVGDEMRGAARSVVHITGDNAVIQLCRAVGVVLSGNIECLVTLNVISNSANFLLH